MALTHIQKKKQPNLQSNICMSSLHFPISTSSESSMQNKKLTKKIEEHHESVKGIIIRIYLDHKVHKAILWIRLII